MMSRFGERGETKLIVLVSFGRKGLVMVTLLSWMANVRTSFCTVRIPVWNRTGLTLGSSCPLRTRVVCCLPTCVQGSSAAVTGGLLGMVHFGHSGCFLESCAYGRCCCCKFSSLMSTRLGLRRCAYRWTRPVGGGRWWHYLRDPGGVHWFAQKCAIDDHGNGGNSIFSMLHVLALAGPTSLHGNYA